MVKVFDGDVSIIDARAISKTVPMAEAVEIMRSWLRDVGRENRSVPPRIPVDVGEGRLVFTIGGGNIGSESIAGFRVYHDRTFPSDRASEFTAVYDSHAGKLRALIIGTELGAWRTGALGGVAIDVLAPMRIDTLGILGAGIQARMQALAAFATRAVAEIHIYSRSAKARSDLARDLHEVLGIPVRAANSARDVVKEADVIITATSSSEPILDASWIRPRCHINHIGPKRSGRCELPEELFRNADMLITDSISQARNLGSDFILAATGDLSRLRSLSDLLNAPFSRSGSGTSVYLSCGLSGTEVLLASTLVQRIHGFSRSLGEKEA